ncbi:hypothetical protein L6164_033372 [Bauhinia variegata]|uniref:Uncharacterized protein n=1 Tax=Bauhinia variegata TaxID=167791 RepID=A0ACB9KRU2_BAUVA|nr:hypothetical protein L6164_033372 [Bauhinia variegata]
MAIRFLNSLVLLLLVLQIHGSSSEAEAGNIMVQCKDRERQALLALKQDFIDDYGFLSSWGNGEKQKECCKWEGIRCSNRTGHVVRLDLHADLASLQGTINPSLAELRHLNYLDLSNNIFLDINHLPEFIGYLTHLKYLNLSGLNCGGRIPHEFGNLSRLQYLDLSFNSLRGRIPDQLWHLTSLVHLDLGANKLQGRIPLQIGNLSSLQHLDLVGNYLTGTIPYDLGNLTHLQYLDLSHIYVDGNDVYNLTSDLEWLSHLSSLKNLHLAQVDLSSASNWAEQVSNLFQLEELSFFDCNLLPNTSSFSSMPTNITSNSLASVDLSLNKLTFSIIPWLLSHTTSLTMLDLSGNHLSGPIPEAFGNFSFLEELNLGDNQLEGEMPRSLGEICSLKRLVLHRNNLTGLQDFVSSSTGPRCGLKSIQRLDLAENQITGPFPNLSQFSSLQILYLQDNHLSGTLSESIGQLSNLTDLRVSDNSLRGVISQAHFSELSKLIFLDLSLNALVFNITDDWIPPFNLGYLNLASCKLGPSFPRWLQTQNELNLLDISNTEISEIVPTWFWNLSPWLAYLNLSHNYIKGKIENLALTSNSSYPEMDLSSNLFEGSIPGFLSIATTLDLSNNNFTDASDLLCAKTAKELLLLDISNNQLWGELPRCQMHLESLVLLDLTNNNLQGTIPESVGLSTHIQSLHLGNNNFIGELPSSLRNCTELIILDAIQNSLSGPIPSWIGDELRQLVVLSLRSNRFSGTLPSSICHLSQLQLLDLSSNNISGLIPVCLGNLTALAHQYASNLTISYYFMENLNNRTPAEGFYTDAASIIWKGYEAKYKNTLGLLRSIDLSSNKLFGEIPSNIMNLIGLISFNVSRNNLSGEIPPSIGQLKLLDFLDMSRNHLFGEIPLQLSQIDRLSVLDLSYNNLSGEIPLGTQLQSFDASAYVGNPELCGAPLLRKCLEKQRNVDRNDDEDGDTFITRGFYISMAVGFVLGFWGVCGSLIFIKSWSYTYFKFLNNIYDTW